MGALRACARAGSMHVCTRVATAGAAREECRLKALRVG